MTRRWGQPITLDAWWATMRWEIAEITGWTLDYIDALSFEDVFEYMSISDGRVKAAKRPKAK